MCSVLRFALFAILYQNVLLHPVDTSVELPANKSVEHVVEMGGNLVEIPDGRVETKSLVLAYNQIVELPELVFYNNSYRSLSRIDLSQNRINTVHVSAFRGLRLLSSVTLASNNISSLDPYVFKHNTKLEKVDLANNAISFNRLRVFLVSSTLETLIVSHNRIEQIYELSLIGVHNLKNLVLDGNALNAIAPNSFKPLNKLQYLSLTNTGVYRLSESMFNGNLPRIIDLQETPLAKRFDPPLKKITNNAVRNLIELDQFIAD